MQSPPHDVRFGNRGSVWVDLEKGIFHDHEANVGGGVLDLITHKTGQVRGEAMDWLRHQGLLSPLSAPPPAMTGTSVQSPNRALGRIVETYPYVDRDSSLLFEVVRYDPKDFRQRRRDATGEWIWNVNGVPRVLYRLPEVINAAAEGRTIFICEGEKDANNICKLGLAATTCPGGAEKWNSSYNEDLRGADVVLLPHNDNPGRGHADHVAAELHGNTARIRVLDIASVWPECPHKGRARPKRHASPSGPSGWCIRPDRRASRALSRSFRQRRRRFG